MLGAEEVPRPIYRRVNDLYKNSGIELLFTRSVHDLIFGFYDELYTDIVDLLENATGADLPDTFGLFATVCCVKVICIYYMGINKNFRVEDAPLPQS